MGREIRNQKSEIRKGSIAGRVRDDGKIQSERPMRGMRAKSFEFERFASKKDGRSVSLRSILISNFEFSFTLSRRADYHPAYRVAPSQCVSHIAGGAAGDGECVFADRAGWDCGERGGFGECVLWGERGGGGATTGWDGRVS